MTDTASSPSASAAAWLEVESLDLEAQGVAHDAQGKVVFIEGALPGEQVQVEITRRKPQWERGRMTARRRDSAFRVTPPCPHFGVCGGCAMQHLDPAAQVAVKQRVLEDDLWHLGKVRPEVMLRPMQGPAWGYRYRARLSVRHVPKKGGVLVGFRERRSSYVADMQSCQVLPPQVSDLLMPLRALIGEMSRPDRLPQIEVAVGDDLCVLVLRHLEPLPTTDLERLRAFAALHQVQWWLQPKGPDTAHPLDERGDVACAAPACGLAPAPARELAYGLPEFGVHMPFKPSDFTQVNPQINRALVGRAVRLLAVQPQDHVIDWFCGLGNFSLPLATRATQVLGIEGSDKLVQRAQANAQLNGLGDRTRFMAQNLFELDADGLRAHGAAQRWLIDPPREGALALCKALADLAAAEHAFHGPQRIVYVSCNPATLARDAGLLVHQAGYRCMAAGVVNMFPHTAHVESMAVFDRQSSGG